MSSEKSLTLSFNVWNHKLKLNEGNFLKTTWVLVLHAFRKFLLCVVGFNVVNKFLDVCRWIPRIVLH